MASEVKNNTRKYIIGDKAALANVADYLFREKVMSREEYEALIHRGTSFDMSFDMSRTLVHSVIKKGDMACTKFLKAWRMYAEVSTMTNVQVLDILDQLSDPECKQFIWYIMNMEIQSKRVPRCDDNHVPNFPEGSIDRRNIADVFVKCFGKDTFSALITTLKRLYRNDLVDSLENGFGTHHPSGASVQTDPGSGTVVQPAESAHGKGEKAVTVVGEVIRQLNNRDMKLFVMNLSANRTGTYEDLCFNTLCTIGRNELAHTIIYKLE